MTIRDANYGCVAESSQVVVPNRTAGGQFDPFAFPRPTDDAVKSSKVMIIDDEPAVVQVISRLLREAGFRNCEGVTESSEAVHCICSVLPDIILLDVRMAPVDGLQILQAIRARDETMHIPVLVVTSAYNEPTAASAFHLGATDLLSKPVRASELIVRTRNILSEKIYRDLVEGNFHRQ